MVSWRAELKPLRLSGINITPDLGTTLDWVINRMHDSSDKKNKSNHSMKPHNTEKGFICILVMFSLYCPPRISKNKTKKVLSFNINRLSSAFIWLAIWHKFQVYSSIHDMLQHFYFSTLHQWTVTNTKSVPSLSVIIRLWNSLKWDNIKQSPRQDQARLSPK